CAAISMQNWEAFDGASPCTCAPYPRIEARRPQAQSAEQSGDDGSVLLEPPIEACRGLRRPGSHKFALSPILVVAVPLLARQNLAGQSCVCDRIPLATGRLSPGSGRQTAPPRFRPQLPRPKALTSPAPASSDSARRKTPGVRASQRTRADPNFAIAPGATGTALADRSATGSGRYSDKSGWWDIASESVVYSESSSADLRSPASVSTRPSYQVA